MSTQETDLLPELYAAGNGDGPADTAGGPLFGLDHHAPSPPPRWSIYDVEHPISNDDLAATFDHTASREQTAGYQEAGNQVAAMVGEGALMASIRHTPEDTILLIDRSPDMVAYMARYVSALRASSDIGEWYERMGFGEHSTEYPRGTGEILRGIFQLQAEYWARAGYDHPVSSDEAFDEAREQAQRKVIIPWRADITEGRDMGRLGRALRAYDASITLLNLTNVLVCDDRIRTGEEAAGLLEGLPFAPDVPVVLTTEADQENSGGFKFTHPTRLFFGLDDLRDNGGVADIRSPRRGAAVNPVVRS